MNHHCPRCRRGLPRTHKVNGYCSNVCERLHDIERGTKQRVNLGWRAQREALAKAKAVLC